MKIAKMEGSVDSAIFVFLSIRNHMERSEEYKERKGFKFTSKLIHQSCLLLQKCLKGGCSQKKNASKILKLCIMIIDCFVLFITCRLIHLGLEISLKDLAFIQNHFYEFIQTVQKTKRDTVTENQELKKELLSKFGLILRLIKLKQKQPGEKQ